MPIRTIRAQALVQFSLLAALLGVSSSATLAQTSGYQPVTISDDSGSQTTFTSAPRRIVSLNPGHTATVFALGAGDRLVAVDSYSNDPPEAEQVQPRLMTYPTVSIETVVALKPDLVLSLVESDDVVAQLRHQGIPVLKLFPKTYAAAADEIANLGRVLDAPEHAEQLAATMRRRRDAVQQAVGYPGAKHGPGRPVLHYRNRPAPSAGPIRRHCRCWCEKSTAPPRSLSGARDSAGMR
jgi:iron complex transport system substrate-binding protein